jgi:hypothetical protein
MRLIERFYSPHRFSWTFLPMSEATRQLKTHFTMSNDFSSRLHFSKRLETLKQFSTLTLVVLENLSRCNLTKMVMISALTCNCQSSLEPMIIFFFSFVCLFVCLQHRCNSWSKNRYLFARKVSCCVSTRKRTQFPHFLPSVVRSG